MKKLNKKGFTLVELLAVIVVLAIIMVLTLPTIMKSMSSARQSTFLLYANRMLDTAADQYQSDDLLGTGKKCYSITKLNNGNTTKYTGKVYISDNGTVFKIKMYDDNFQIGFNCITKTIKETNESGDQVDKTVCDQAAKLSDKAGGVGYSDIETIKKQLANDDVKLQEKPTSTTGIYADAGTCTADEEKGIFPTE